MHAYLPKGARKQQSDLFNLLDEYSLETHSLVSAITMLQRKAEIITTLAT